jgi:hypothetical protein
MTRRRPEQELQRAVFAHFDFRSAPNTFAFHPFNGGRRSPIEAAIYTKLGVRPGVPDVIAIQDGHAFALELKAERGRLSQSQVETMRLLQDAGTVVGVANGIDEAIALLEFWGLLRGTAQ